jgi:hypothetical protein
MDEIIMTENRFIFRGDAEKEPLVAFSVSYGEKAEKMAAEALIYRRNGSKIGAVIGAVLFLIIMVNIAAAAVTVGAYGAAVMYGIFCVGAGAVFMMPRLNAKKVTRIAPYKSEYFVYSFYRHHFTVASEFEGSSFSYDDMAFASEDSLGFTLYMNNDRVYIIMKSDLDTKEISMVHAVMENKLGSKFDVKFL